MGKFIDDREEPKPPTGIVVEYEVDFESDVTPILHRWQNVQTPESRHDDSFALRRQPGHAQINETLRSTRRLIFSLP